MKLNQNNRWKGKPVPKQKLPQLINNKNLDFSGDVTIAFELYFNTNLYTEFLFFCGLEMEVRKNEVQVDDSSSAIQDEEFVDKHSGKLFRRFRYFDHYVYQEVSTRRVNVGQFIGDTTEPGKKRRAFDKFRQSGDDYERVISLGREMLIAEKMNQTYIQGQSETSLNSSQTPVKNTSIYEPSLIDVERYIFINYNEGYGRKISGTYAPFKIFQLIALWADKKHILSVLELLEKMNEKANLMHVSAYDVIKEENARLDEEIAKLKRENETLKIQHETDLEVINKFNIPYNKMRKSSYIHAVSVDENHFRLYYDRGYGNSKAIRSYETPNARDLKDELMKELEHRRLIEHIDGKRIISKNHLDEVFSLIEEIATSDSIIVPSKEERDEFINERLAHWRAKPLTPQNEGHIYEYEIIRSRPELIPWKFIPRNLMYHLNEQRREKGIDAIEISSEGQIKTIVQIKHHRGSYLRIEEVDQFIGKTHEDQYKAVKKILILHGCKLSKKLKALIESNGIMIETIGE